MYDTTCGGALSVISTSGGLEPLCEKLMPTVDMVATGILRFTTDITIDGIPVLHNDNAPGIPFKYDFQNVSSGGENPKWRSQVKNHLSATVGYSATKSKVKITNGSMSTTNEPYTGWRYTEEASGIFIQDATPPSTGPSGDAGDNCYTDFIRKAQRGLRSINGLQALGELSELVHAVRHPLESLKNGMRDYLVAVPKRARSAARLPKLPSGIDRDLNPRGVLSLRQGKRRRSVSRVSRSRAISNAISGTYLEYANGWAPAVNDIVSASRALAEHYTPSGIGYRKISASAEGTETHSVTAPQLRALSSYKWSQHEVYRSKESARMVGEVVVSSSGSGQDLRRNTGFTLAGFIPTIWELLPLSYVADYFSNIGNVLEAIAFNHASVSWVSRTVRLTSSKTVYGSTYPPPLGSAFLKYGGDPGNIVWTQTIVMRDNPDGYRPNLSFSLPGSHLLSKLANVSSLLAQANNASKQLSRFLNG